MMASPSYKAVNGPAETISNQSRISGVGFPEIPWAIKHNRAVGSRIGLHFLPAILCQRRWLIRDIVASMHQTIYTA